MKSAAHLELADQLLQLVIRVPQLAFPDNVTAPAGSLQSIDVSLVAGNVFTKLLAPEFVPGLGSGSIAAIGVPVPKAAVNEDTGFPLWQNNIRPSWQVFPMEPESVAASMQEFAHGHFRFRIAASYGSHHSGSRGCIDNIHPVSPSGC